jgi:hypothetical protein
MSWNNVLCSGKERVAVGGPRGINTPRSRTVTTIFQSSEPLRKISELPTFEISADCSPYGRNCWGKWPLEVLSTSGQADGFGSRAASATRGSFRSDGLTETLMLLELCGFCCAGVAHLSGAGLRCRRHGSCASALKVWRKQKRRASRTPRAGAGGGMGEISREA